MIAGIIGEKRVGKGIVGVGLCLFLMAFGGYSPTDSCGNSTIKLEGYQKFTNSELRHMLNLLVERHVQGKLIYIAEADRAFPPRYWRRAEQTDALIGLQQEQKLCDWLVYDSHFGGVDCYLDEVTQVFIYPKYEPERDQVRCSWYRPRRIMPIQHMTFYNVSKWIFPYCITEEPVD